MNQTAKLLFASVLLVIVTIVSVYVYYIKERFIINDTIYSQSVCSEYLKTHDKYQSSALPMMDEDRLNVLANMTNAYSKDDKVKVDGCVFMPSTFSTYNIKNCRIKNIQLDNNDGKQIAPSGCLVDFNKLPPDSQAFLSILDYAHGQTTQSFDKQIKQMESSIQAKQSATAVNYSQASQLEDQADVENAQADKNFVQVDINKMYAENAIDKAKEIEILNEKLDENSELLALSISNQFNTSDIRFGTLADNTPVLQKRFGNDYYNMVWKYTNTAGDAFDFWRGTTNNHYDVLSKYKSGISFLQSNDFYRNKNFMQLFYSKDVYDIVIEVYNSSINPIATMMFTKGQTDDILTWFTRKNLVKSSIPGLNNRSSFQFFSIEGHGVIKRRWFINLYYCGCDCDPSILCIPCSIPGTVCEWDRTYNRRILVATDEPFNFGGRDSTFKGKNVQLVTSGNLGTRMVVYAKKRGQTLENVYMNSEVRVLEYPPPQIGAAKTWTKLGNMTYKKELKGAPYGNGVYEAQASSVWDYRENNEIGMYEWTAAGAFDKQPGDGYRTPGWHSHGDIRNQMTSTADKNPPAFVSLKMPDKISLLYYKIQNRSDGWEKQAPSSWQLMGSNDGTSWMEVDAQTGVTNWSLGEEKTFYLNVPSSAFSMFKIVIKRNSNTSSDNVEMGELRFFGTKQ